MADNEKDVPIKEQDDGSVLAKLEDHIDHFPEEKQQVVNEPEDNDQDEDDPIEAAEGGEVDSDPEETDEDREKIREAAIKIRAMGVEVGIPEFPEPPEPTIEPEDGAPCERPCLDDEGKTAVVGGLVMSSISFLGLTFFTGRNPRRRDEAMQPPAQAA